MEFSLLVSQPTNSLAASIFFDAAPTESPQPPSNTASGVGDQPRSEATTDLPGSSNVEKPPPHMKPCAEAPTAQALTISGKSQVRLPGGLIFCSCSTMNLVARSPARLLSVGMPLASV